MEATAQADVQTGFIEEPNDPYEVFRPLMSGCGATCSPKEFYWAVNEALHSTEAEVYDAKHASMFVEEAFVLERLFSYLPDIPKKLRFLDVGCGTGLVGNFASLYIPDRVSSMTLLDPSERMLEEVSQRAESWPFPTDLRLGDIFTLDTRDRYDVVTINSVMHHIVELEAFAERIEALVKPGGLVLTAQDPRSENKTIADPALSARRLTDVPLWNVPAWIGKPNRLKRIRRAVGRFLRPRFLPVKLSPFALRISEILIRKGVIREPLSEPLLYEITDVHVPGQPNRIGKGIDEDDLLRWMPKMSLNAVHTYRFHDVDYSRLSESQKQKEMKWWADKDPHGTNIALVFIKSMR